MGGSIAVQIHAWPVMAESGASLAVFLAVFNGDGVNICRAAAPAIPGDIDITLLIYGQGVSLIRATARAVIALLPQ
jgi:hypothetical protein